MVQMAQYFHSKLHTILVHNPWRAVLCAIGQVSPVGLVLMPYYCIECCVAAVQYSFVQT
jgi:hypothetical protein